MIKLKIHNLHVCQTFDIEQQTLSCLLHLSRNWGRVPFSIACTVPLTNTPYQHAKIYFGQILNTECQHWLLCSSNKHVVTGEYWIPALKRQIRRWKYLIASVASAVQLIDLRIIIHENVWKCNLILDRHFGKDGGHYDDDGNGGLTDDNDKNGNNKDEGGPAAYNSLARPVKNPLA